MRTHTRFFLVAGCIAGMTALGVAQTTTAPTPAPPTATSPQPSTAPGAVTRSTPQSAPATVTRPSTTPATPATAMPGSPQADPATPPVAQPLRPSVPAVSTQPSTLPAPGVTNNANTSLDANAPVAASGVSVDALAAAGIDVAVDPQSALASLQRANRSTAATAVSELRARVEATNRALTELRSEAGATGVPIDPTVLEQTSADLRSQENMLRQALANAQRATTDAEWRQAQTQLATQYQLYAQAVRRAQTLMAR